MASLPAASEAKNLEGHLQFTYQAVPSRQSMPKPTHSPRGLLMTNQTLSHIQDVYDVLQN